MKKNLFLIVFIFITNFSFAAEGYFTKVNKNIYKHENLHSKQEIIIIYNNQGYIQSYSEKLTYSESDDIYENNINLSYNTNSILIDYVTNINGKISNNQEKFIYQNKKWILENDETGFSVSYDLNSIKATVNDSQEPINSFTVEKNKFIYSYFQEVINYTLENDKLISLINPKYENYPKDSSEYLDEYQIFYTYKNNKIFFEKTYDSYTENTEIETNYNFISWKVTSANFLLDIKDYTIIPFILGFGNGFEFKEGVDYSGENEEPLKKNDETVEPVSPENTNNKPIIYAVSTLIIIILASVLIIVFKKKKNK